MDRGRSAGREAVKKEVPIARHNMDAKERGRSDFSLTTPTPLVETCNPTEFQLITMRICLVN